MKNDDKKSPTGKITLSGNPRNKAVIKISALGNETVSSGHRPEDHKESEEEDFEEDRTSVKSGGGERSGEERSFGSFLVELVISAVLLAALCSFRTVQVYANNTDLVSFSDLGNSMWAYMCISIAVFALLRIFIRRPYFACVFTAFGTFFAVNLGWLVDIVRLFIKSYKPAAIGALVLYFVLLAGFFFFLRMLYKKNVGLHVIVKILAATFTCLILFNVVMAFIAVESAAAYNEQEPAVSEVVIATPAPMPDPSLTPDASGAAPVPSSQTFGTPNIYFFLLDEYSSFDMLQKYYGYDNKVFNDFLVSKGFNISRESYGTDNQTEHAICDLVNLDYISKPLSKSECVKSITNGLLQKKLSELGYSQYRLLGGKYFAGVDTLYTDNGFDYSDNNTMFSDQGTQDISGDITGVFGLLTDPDPDTEVDAAALNQLGVYPSSYIRNTEEYKKYKDKDNLAYADTLLNVFDYLENPSSYTDASPCVFYNYILATHVPFLFNEYGGIISYSQDRNWEDTDVYLDQYKFVTKHLIASISTIIRNDPDSIIIVMSDHGIRYHADCKLKHTFYITNKDSCRIMNAFYIKGQKYDIEGLSSVNTLRFILSLYDGQDYPPIEDPITPDSPDNLKGIIPKPR